MSLTLLAAGIILAAVQFVAALPWLWVIDPKGFARASRILALASLPAAVGLGARWGWPNGAWLIAPFVMLAVRAFVVPPRPLRPGAIGVIELGCFLLVAATALLASQ